MHAKFTFVMLRRASDTAAISKTRRCSCASAKRRLFHLSAARRLIAEERVSSVSAQAPLHPAAVFGCAAGVCGKGLRWGDVGSAASRNFIFSSSRCPKESRNKRPPLLCPAKQRPSSVRLLRARLAHLSCRNFPGQDSRDAAGAWGNHLCHCRLRPDALHCAPFKKGTITSHT
jgi:hypothetical protein